MYLYAYTARKVYPNGKIETICGSWSRDDPISTPDEYTKTAKEIMSSCGFDNGVITSFSLICSPNLTKQTKTIEQHRAEFEEWAKNKGCSVHLSPSWGYLHGYVEMCWQAWLAARGLKP